MAEKIESLKDIKSAASATAEVKTRKPSRDKQGRSYATGKRKNAIAKVWISEGNGTFIINGKPANEYLKRAILDVIINQPFQYYLSYKHRHYARMDI